MKWSDMPRRPYYDNYERVDIKNNQKWFEVYKLPGDVYAICEPQHFQEVNFFLIIGSERALLLDTGMGICDAKAVIDELYSGKVIAVNSHFHFDHVGNNWKFQPVHAFDDPYVIAASKKERTSTDFGDQFEEKMFHDGYPEGFDPDAFRIRPYDIIPIREGHMFDLGNRTLTVYHTPGHSNDSIMLYDNKDNILFTGDTFYMGALYAHFHNDQFGHSTLNRYCDTLARIYRELPDVKVLYPSHNELIVDPIKLKEASEGMNAIIDGTADQQNEMDSGHEYLEDGTVLAQYQFDGFSIIYDPKSN